MHTQSSSRTRVKNDTLGKDGMKVLFEEYAARNFNEFRAVCVSLISQSSGKQTTKDKFIGEINRATSKDVMLTKVTNYILAGQGLGV